MNPRPTPEPRPTPAAGSPDASSSNRPGGWRVYLSADVLERTATMTLVEMRVLLALEQYARDKSSCWPNNPRLAKDVGCTTRRVRSALAKLESAGWIRRVMDPARKTREQIILLRRLDPDRPTDGPRGPEMEGRPRPTPGTPASGGGGTPASGARRTPASAGISTKREAGQSEKNTNATTQTYSAHADRDPRGRGYANRSAGWVGRRARKPPRLNAREMDTGIREYAAVAGAPPPPSPLSEAVEPFG